MVIDRLEIDLGTVKSFSHFEHGDKFNAVHTNAVDMELSNCLGGRGMGDGWSKERTGGQRPWAPSRAKGLERLLLVKPKARAWMEEHVTRERSREIEQW